MPKPIPGTISAVEKAAYNNELGDFTPVDDDLNETSRLIDCEVIRGSMPAIQSLSIVTIYCIEYAFCHIAVYSCSRRFFFVYAMKIICAKNLSYTPTLVCRQFSTGRVACSELN